MGFLSLALLAAAALGLLAVLGVGRLLWSLIGAALVAGAAGYAVQGRPFQPGQAPRPQTAAATFDPTLVALRDQMLGRLNRDWSYQIAADAMRRAGEDRLAVQAILGGLRRSPRSLMLWTGLGEALAAYDGRVSPPALLAFRRAAGLAPLHPAPPFFLGLAHIRAGDLAAARPLWARAVALSPAGTSYRQEIAMRLMLLDGVLAQDERSSTTAR